MKILFFPALYTGTIELCPKTINYLISKKIKCLGLYAAAQFGHLEKVKQQLQELGIKVLTSRPKRAAVLSQILGCDSYPDALNLEPRQLEQIEAFLYIGDGKFHPLALVYDSDKEVICYNPITKQFQVLTKKDVEPVMRRYKGTLAKFHNAGNIGVLISLKPGQEFYKKSLELEKKYPNKRFYYFVDNEVSFGQLENFNFIDVWVNTACPRIALDDSEMFRVGVVNLREVLKSKATCLELTKIKEQMSK